MAYLVLYVDDIVLTASSTTLLHSLIAALRTDMGDLHYFLGISVKRSKECLFLSQETYALDLLERAGMLECKFITTPVDSASKLSAKSSDPVADPTEYHSIAGGLQYLTFTQPDIQYAVQQICLHMHDPQANHLLLVKRVLRYIRGTTDYGLTMYRHTSNKLTAYSDADWAGCPDTCCSTSGYCVLLGANLVSWSAKRQHTVSRSSAEAEYRAVANVVAEACWLRQLLQELHRPVSGATVVLCGNVSYVYMTQNPVHHQHTKHVEIDLQDCNTTSPSIKLWALLT
jgi:hypothetical protein